MAQRYSVEELIINDSFIAYCFHSNEADVRCWEEYLVVFPDEQQVVEQARDMVLGLSIFFHDQQDHAFSKELEAGEYIYKEEAPAITERGAIHILPWKKYIVAAAAVVAVALLFTWRWKPRTVPGAEIPEGELSIFITQKGQKKLFYLPDSSRVELNAGSILRISKGFGVDNRTVALSGEAYFDVRHKEKHPFIVTTEGYKVSVLGTSFNVRAYADERTTEMDLVSGKVQVEELATHRQWTLRPLQKLVLASRSGMNAIQDTSVVIAPAPTPLLVRGRDSIITETAWHRNRLEIVNESLSSMKSRLERWFNVKIVFTDQEVSTYPFTGSFSNESIGEVLKAFQYSYHFNYKIEGDNITISK